MMATTTWAVVVFVAAVSLVDLASSDEVSRNPFGDVSLDRPNILLMHPDDLYFDFGDWSLEDSTVTPNIHRIRDEGMRFSRAFSAASKCQPSRMATLTGRYASSGTFAYEWTQRRYDTTLNTKVDSRSSKLTGLDLEENVARRLRDCGYETGQVGKWHIAEGLGDGYGSTYEEQTATAAKAGFSFVDGFYASNMDGSLPFSHNMEWLTEKALVFLSEEPTSPHFLFWNPTCPHDPSVSNSLNNPTGGYVLESTPAGTVPTPDLLRFCDGCGMPARSEVWSKARTVSSNADVAAAVWIDGGVGSILAYLEETGMDAYTYVIFTGDHGRSKDTIDQNGFETMLYVRGPGIAAGSTWTDPVSHVDLAPTIIDLAGGAVANYFTDGFSWAPAAFGLTTEPTREYVALESNFEQAVVWLDGGRMYKMVDEGQGPLYKNDDDHVDTQASHMYELDTDPGEDNDVYDASRTDEIFVALRSMLDELTQLTYQRHVTQVNATCAGPPVTLPTVAPTLQPSPEPTTAQPSAQPTLNRFNLAVTLRLLPGPDDAAAFQGSRAFQDAFFNTVLSILDLDAAISNFGARDIVTVRSRRRLEEDLNVVQLSFEIEVAEDVSIGDFEVKVEEALADDFRSTLTSEAIGDAEAVSLAIRLPSVDSVRAQRKLPTVPVSSSSSGGSKGLEGTILVVLLVGAAIGFIAICIALLIFYQHRRAPPLEKAKPIMQFVYDGVSRSLSSSNLASSSSRMSKKKSTNSLAGSEKKSTNSLGEETKEDKRTFLQRYKVDSAVMLFPSKNEAAAAKAAKAAKAESAKKDRRADLKKFRVKSSVMLSPVKESISVTSDGTPRLQRDPSFSTLLGDYWSPGHKPSKDESTIRAL